MLKIYNTLTKKKEKFYRIAEKKISFYHCGPTVYWTQHIGNLRAVVLSDLIVRTLEYLEYDVTLVRNYTDVGHLSSDEDEGEDKMIKGAKRDGLKPEEIAIKYINIFEDDVNKLNAKQPDFKPRATEHIKEMLEMVKILLAKTFAYQTELAIYFDVNKAKNYTKLSKQNLEKHITEAGSGEASDQNKKNPADFVLWFFKKGAHKNALQTWPSPWGEGFPGWHIECSAMSKKYLGETIDMHMGGIEHIPVHHTNEIAQSESANGKTFVRYWLHNEHLTVNGEKMAKSQGTAFSLSDLQEKGYEPLALRYFYLGAHYRSKQNFNWEAINSAQTALKKLRSEVIKIKNSVISAPSEAKINEKYRLRFIEAISDDFNIPKALAILWEVIKDDKMTNDGKHLTIINFDLVLGLKLNELKPEKFNVPIEIQAMVDNRNKFRELGDFEQADAIREEIEEMGYIIEDSESKTIIKKNKVLF